MIGGGIAAAIGLYFAAIMWYDAQIDEAYQSGRTAAISECNTVQLETDLAEAVAASEALEKRFGVVSTELASQQAENVSQTRFIATLETRISGFADGAASPRSIELVRILSERAAQYHPAEVPSDE